MEPRNRYGHSFVLAFSAPSVPQDFRFNEHTHTHIYNTYTTGRERGEIDTKRKRVKRERDKVRERAMREHIYVYTMKDVKREREREIETPTRERNARQYVTDGRMQFTTFYERSLSVFPPLLGTTFRHGSCISVRVTDRDEREREREKDITGNEFSRVHAWLLELLFSSLFPSRFSALPPERISRSSLPPLPSSFATLCPRSSTTRRFLHTPLSPSFLSTLGGKH